MTEALKRKLGRSLFLFVVLRICLLIFLARNFSYITRESNFAAHNLSRWALLCYAEGDIPISSILDVFCNYSAWTPL